LSEELRARRALSVTLDSSLERDLGLDSLARVELLARLEARLHVALPESVLAAAETPRDLLSALAGAQEPHAAGPVMPTSSPAPLREAEPAPMTVQTLIEMLVWHAQHHPDRPHVRVLQETEDETLTCSELSREAQSVAAGLQAHGIGPGESVVLMLPTSRDYFLAFYGVMLAGAVPVPIYPPARLSQLEDHVRRHTGILANALASALITVPEAKPVARLLTARLERLTHVLTVAELKSNAAFHAPAITAADTALIQYTSGSTGNPKGVVLTHAQLLANIRAVGIGVNATPADVFVSWLPLYHDMGLIGAWLATMYHAIPLIVMSPITFLLHPAKWLRAIERYRGTISASPNFGYELCLRRIDDADIEGLDLSSLRAAFNGAELVSPVTIDRFCERFSRYGFRREAMFPVYGLAEAALGLTFPPIERGPLIDPIGRDTFLKSRHAVAVPDDPAALRFVSSGHPLPGYEIRIVDRAGRELPERVEGRLEFRGPSTTTGYFRNPDATRQLIVDGWLDSGDLAYVAGSEVFITGRTKDVVIHAGRNIYPDELEEAVGDIPGIRKGRVAVFGSPDPASGTERLVVVAETHETTAAARRALISRINALTVELTGTAPGDVCLAPPQSILKTSSGKIRRTASREAYEQGALGAAKRPLAWQVARLALGAAMPQLRGLIRRSTAFLYAAYAWTLFVLLGSVVLVLVATLPTLNARWYAMRFGARSLARVCAIPISVHGLENLPPPERGCIVVVNHASYLDGYVLVATLPHPVSFIAKTEFQRARVLGSFLRRIGCTFVERFDRQQGIADARRLVEAARAGKWLAFFPEGTFTRAPGLLPFRLGAFNAAAEAQVPLIPITLHGTRSVLRDGSWFPRRGPIGVTVGPPLDAAALAAEVRDNWSLALRLRDAARAEILRNSHEPDLA
jgi:1-acyl-sn-glycerol-3-phosphate acyltransferase